MPIFSPVLSFFVVLFAAAMLPTDDTNRWQGKTIVPLRGGLDLTYIDPGGGEHVTYRNLGSGVVVAVTEDRLWVREGSGATGWVDKDDVLPVDEAVAHFTKTIREGPADLDAWLHRGLAWEAKRGYEQALKDYNEVIRRKPDYAIAFNNRGVVHRSLRQYDRAVADFSEAIRLDPGHVLALRNRGLTRRFQKEYDLAIADFTAALRLDPDWALVYHERGLAYAAKKEYEKALEDYRESARLGPASAPAANSVAWVLATCPKDELRDGRRAVAYAEQACRRTAWKNAQYLDTLAAAYAEAGDFEQAVKWSKEAIGRASHNRIEAYRKGLMLYEQRRPFRE